MSPTPSVPRIDVLLSTYNGSRYIREQVDSILAQEGVQAHVIARDDGSSDGTDGIIEEYERIFPGRFKVLRELRGNIGITRSYEALLKASPESYISFADQDDVWDLRKLSKSLDILRGIEGDGTIPALVYTDLRIVSEALEIRHESFFKFMGINPFRARSVKSLAVQNCVVGCTAIFNRALADHAAPFPDTCLMHDWWLALCAARFGKTAYLPETTMQYRQHPANVVGARSLLSRLASAWRRRNSTFRSLDQAISLLDLAGAGNPADTDFLTGLKMRKRTFTKKLYLMKNGAYKDGLLRNLYFFLLARSS